MTSRGRLAVGEMECITALCFAVILLILKTDAEVALKISKSGLNYAAKTAAQAFLKRLSIEQIKDQQIQDGDVEGDVYNIKIIDLDAQPSVVVDLEPSSSTMRVSTTFDFIECSADWRYAWKVTRFFTLRDKGSLTVRATGFSATVEVAFGSDPTLGKLTVQSTDCKSRINDISLDFKGKSDLIYNTIAGLANDALRGILEEEICRAARNAINTKLNDKLSTLTTVVRIDDDLYFDYRLTSAPQIYDDYLELRLEGSVFGGVVPREDFVPGPVAACEGGKKMLSAMFTEDSFNSYLKSLYLANKLQRVVTRNDVPNSKKSLMDTDCTKATCLLRMILTNFQPIPNASLEIDLKVSEAPVVRINEQGISSNIRFVADMYVRHYSNDSRTYLFPILSNTSLKLSAEVESDLLKYRLAELKSSVKLEGGTEFQVNEKGLTFYVNLVNKLLEIQVNKLGQQGIPLPDMKKIRLDEIEILPKNSALCILADVIYTI